jgi:aminoglycoside/choline kinase family phosphotransferase
LATSRYSRFDVHFLLVASAPLPAPVVEYLDRAGLASPHVIALTGDASDRRYFRVLPRDKDGFILAVYAAPFDYDTLPFVNVAQLFESMPVPIPTIVGQAADVGVLALADLGDVTLQAHVGGGPAGAQAAYYRQAISYIETMQRRGAELADPKYIPYGIAFDEQKLMWEMDFFLKHFLEAYRGVAFAPDDRDALRAELNAIVVELAAEPRVLCHRDYHSRNLMMTGDRIYIIDFQDARMGPDTYDLASLLRDSYVDISEDALADFIAYFLALSRFTGDEAEFRRRFDVMTLQRNLKALGTFGYQTVARANPVYIQYMARTLRYARANLAKYARFERLGEMLAKHVPELA